MDIRLKNSLTNNIQNYLAPFLWLHNEDDSKILCELEKIYASGIRGVCLESRTHAEFCNDDWWSDCRLIMDFCREHDMKVWILDDKHFPSGYANGYIREHQEYAQWNITERHMDVPGPVNDGCTIADKWLMNDDDSIIGVFACEHIPDSEMLTGRVIDLSGNIVGGNLYFDLPEGMWRIVYLIRSQKSIASKGQRSLWYCDKLNAEATKVYIREVHEKHYENLSEYFGNTFVGFFADEPGFIANGGVHNGELGNVHYFHPWNDSVREHFEKLYGDSAMKNLLALWFEFRDIPYMDYRVEYMNFITDEYKKNFTKLISDWCSAHGVMYTGHVIEDNHCHANTSYGAGHYFKALEDQHMAGIDIVLNQLIPGLTECSNAGSVSYIHMKNKFFNYYLAKLGSSLAHYKPHMKGRVMCEIFGAFGWAESPSFMKYLADHMLVRGINFFVPHAFSPNDDPYDCPPTFYLGGRNPQYPHFFRIMNYMNRVCYMLNDGTHVNTCALLYDVENHWSRAKALPLEDIAKRLYDDLLDFDILPIEAVAEIKDSKLANETYKLLFVPESEYMRSEVRETLKNADIRVVVVSDKPDDDFENVPLDGICDFVRDGGYGDVLSPNENYHLRYFHYVRDSAHIYMFTNEDINNSIKTTAKLSAFDGGKYIVYDAFENIAYKKTSTDGNIELELAPYNSVLVMVGDVDIDGIEFADEKQIVGSTELSLSYDISLCDVDAEGYTPYKTTDRLPNINGRDGVQDFAGNIRYNTTLEITSDGEYLLDLGEVGEVATVAVNGEVVGTRMFTPYRFDISKAVKVGANDVEITVTTDAGYKFRDNISRYMLMRPTGLIGPVKLHTVE